MGCENFIFDEVVEFDALGVIDNPHTAFAELLDDPVTGNCFPDHLSSPTLFMRSTYRGSDLTKSHQGGISTGMTR